jgi:hypothetical protein
MMRFSIMEWDSVVGNGAGFFSFFVREFHFFYLHSSAKGKGEIQSRNTPGEGTRCGGVFWM